MIRIRRAAPWLIAAALLMIGTTMGFASAQGSGGGAISSLAEWIVGNVIALLGGAVVVLKAAQVWLKGHVAETLKAHDVDRTAHDIAARHNHDPLHAAINESRVLLESIKVRLDQVLEGEEGLGARLVAHDARLGRIEVRVGKLCAEQELMHAAQLGKRRDDPDGADHTDERGKP